jgi:hypothetical protein
MGAAVFRIALGSLHIEFENFKAWQISPQHMIIMSTGCNGLGTDWGIDGIF